MFFTAGFNRIQPDACSSWFGTRIITVGNGGGSSRTGNDEGSGEMKRILLAGVAAALIFAGAIWDAATAGPPAGRAFGLMPGGQTVSGTVSLGKDPFRERRVLPGMAMLHVELLDVSAKDPRSGTLGEETIWVANGRLPVSFRIAYDPSRIDPARTYAIRARIMEEEKLLFLNSTPCYVLTRGAPSNVDIIVTPAKARIR
jgi:putative lipoprotein